MPLHLVQFTSCLSRRRQSIVHRNTQLSTFWFLQYVKAYRGSRSIAPLIRGTRRRWVVSFKPLSLYPLKEHQYVLKRKLAGTKIEKEISFPTPGFEPLMVQPRASRYTDWAIVPGSQVTDYIITSISVLVKYNKICLQGVQLKAESASREHINIPHNTRWFTLRKLLAVERTTTWRLQGRPFCNAESCSVQR